MPTRRNASQEFRRVGFFFRSRAAANGLLARRNAPAAWSVNGRPVAARRLRPGVFRLPLDPPVRTGQRVAVACDDGRDNLPVAVHPNPVVFETAAGGDEPSPDGPYAWYRPTQAGRAVGPHAFETLLVGSKDIEQVVQPLPVVPTVADAFPVAARCGDVERLIRRSVLGVADVAVAPGAEWVPGRAPAVRRAVRVRLELGPDRALTPAAVTRAARRLLLGRIPIALDLFVDATETDHDRRPPEPRHPEPGSLPRRVRGRGAAGAPRRVRRGA